MFVNPIKVFSTKNVTRVWQKSSLCCIFTGTSFFPLGNSETAKRHYFADGPLTVRGRSGSVKKPANAADEIARTKFELLEPIAIADMPRAQQRFARQIHKFNRDRVAKIFAKNIKMIINGLIVVALVIVIYTYTIWMMRRETFLEEIDEEVAIERGEMALDEQGRLIAIK